MSKKILSNVDYPFLAITLSLLSFGLIMLYSASTVQSYQHFGTTTHYIIHQALYGGVVGLIVMAIASRIDYHVWLKALPVLLLVSFLSLIMVKIPGMGFSAGGATRWVYLGPLSFQPGELAKLVIIFYLAAWTQKKSHALNDFYLGLLPSLIIVLMFAGLILAQPDFGTMLVLIAISGIMLFVAGVNWKYIIASIVTGALSLYLLIRFEPYRVRRLTSFFDPKIDPQGISYQISQALLGIGAGGLWGYGYGLSRQKHSYLPEASSDSIFAVMAEELGFFRVLIVLALFAAFAWRGFHIAKHAPDTFGRMVALGVTAWITMQALINVGAMVNFLPLTGIPLPFFSYGSTALIMNLGAIGIVLNISRQSNLASAKH